MYSGFYQHTSRTCNCTVLTLFTYLYVYNFLYQKIIIVVLMKREELIVENSLKPWWYDALDWKKSHILSLRSFHYNKTLASEIRSLFMLHFLYWMNYFYDNVILCCLLLKPFIYIFMKLSQGPNCVVYLCKKRVT